MKTLRRLPPVLGGLALLLLACEPGPPTHARSPTPTSALAPTATPAPTVAGPSPVASLLDPVPAHCLSTRPPQSITFAHFGGFSGRLTLVGTAPVWIPQPYFPTMLHLNQLGFDPWPGTKIVWELGPNAPSSLVVQVQITNRTTGQVAWWGQGGPPDQHSYRTAQTLVLDPTMRMAGPAVSHGTSGTGWAEWGSFVYLPQAGCYTLQVNWSGGEWHSWFAAGR